MGLTPVRDGTVITVTVPTPLPTYLVSLAVSSRYAGARYLHTVTMPNGTIRYTYTDDGKMR